MSLLLDSFWRACAYCLHPRVILMSLWPLLVMASLTLGLGYFFWDSTVDAVRQSLESWDLVNGMLGWLQSVGVGNLKSVIAPLVVIFTVTPVIVLVTVVLVALLMTPALVNLVALRRFPALERKKGGPLWLSILWSLGSTLMALIALVVSMPLWLVPPLILVLPPLIWGWLGYRVMTFDALAGHASGDERREIFRRHRPWLLLIGILTGLMAAAPSLVWVSGAMLAVAFVLLVPVAVWIYTLVFSFSSLWFSHYCLAALQALRQAPPPAMTTPAALPDETLVVEPPL